MTPSPRRAGRLWVTPKAEGMLEGAAARPARPRTRSSSSAGRAPPGSRPTRGGRCASRPSSSRASTRWPRSARRSPSSGRPGPRSTIPMYELARTIGRRLAETGYAVITGGGPGTMEAANRGCREGGGLSVGCNIELPHEQGMNAVRRPRRRVPLLLRAQGDVRQVRRRVRDPARRPRHARRAVRVADPHPDRQGPPFPGRPRRARRTGPACSTGCAARCSSAARSPRRTWTCSTSPTTPTRSSSSSGHTGPRAIPPDLGPRQGDLDPAVDDPERVVAQAPDPGQPARLGLLARWVDLRVTPGVDQVGW